LLDALVVSFLVARLSVEYCLETDRLSLTIRTNDIHSTEVLEFLADDKLSVNNLAFLRKAEWLTDFLDTI
jgi:hypothetical protein